MLKHANDETEDADIRFIKVKLDTGSVWNKKTIKELNLPKDVIIVGIERDESFLMPAGDVKLEAGDMLILAAETYKDEWKVELKEIILAYGHPWCDRRIDDLDISRKSFIVMIRRDDRMMIPRGDMRLKEGDVLVIYSEKKMPEASVLKV